MRFHDLRHTSATVGLALGESLREIMERLGHSQIALTMNTYAHIAPALRRAAADRLDRAFGAREDAVAR
jgi:integrase